MASPVSAQQPRGPTSTSPTSISSPKASPPTAKLPVQGDNGKGASKTRPAGPAPGGVPPATNGAAPPPPGAVPGGPNDSFRFDFFGSNSSLSSLSGMSLPSFSSLPSLSSMPPLMDGKDKGPVGEPTHRDATVTATGAPTGTDNGRLVPPSPSTPTGGPSSAASPSPGGGAPSPSSASSSNSASRGGGGQRRAARGQPIAPLQPVPQQQQQPQQQTPPPQQPQQQQSPAQPQGVQSPPTAASPNNALVSASQSAENRRIINPVTVPNGQNFVDITEYLNMPQSEAAKKLSIPPSTLSKRWKEAVRNRKWPWRVVCKLDKEIMTLLHNVPQGAPIPEEIEGRLGYLMRKRQEELKPVVIRL